jgi:tRNA (guanosine-2'-O-)-methyltransferase
MHGLTEEMMEHADEFVKIPMYGFTESFNISVSAALVLNDLVTRLKSSAINWKLEDEEQLDIQIKWLSKTIKGSDKVVKDFLEKHG